MGKKNKFVRIVSISTAIAMSNISVTAAQKVKPETSDKSIFPSAALSSTHTSNIANSHADLNPALSELIAQKIAQSNDAPDNRFSTVMLFGHEPALSQLVGLFLQDTTREINKPAQPSNPDVQELNPSGNPLSFPTTPEEVQVDTQKPITLEQAIELSLKNNKDIENARLDVERAEDVVREERAALFPTLSLTSDLEYSGSNVIIDSVTDEEIEETAESNGISLEASEEFIESNNEDVFIFDSSLILNYDIFTSGGRAASIRAAEKELRSTELNLEVIVEQTRFDTASDYYDLQDSDASVAIQRAAVDDATQTLRDAQLLERAGLGTRFDVLQAEVELAQAEQAVTTALANQSIARRQLAETLSVSHSTDLSTADAIEEAGTWDLGLSETIVQAFKNRAELEQFLLDKEISEEERTIALSNIRPTVSASASYSVDDDFEDEADFGDQYTVGLGLQWTLFDGGAARTLARQAEKDAEIAETLFADQRNQIRFAVEQAFFQLESNQDNIGTARREVELAEESLRLARLRFQAGVGTQTDVIDAQTELTTSRGNLLSSIIDYNQSYADLLRQVSNTPDNGLQDLP